MKTNVESLLQQQLSIEDGLAYLVPFTWWQQTCFINFDITSPDDIKFPTLNLLDYVDSSLLDFQESIQSQIQLKCNFIKLDQFVISPQVKKDVDWKPISPSLWHRINNKISTSFSVFTIYDSKNPLRYLIDKQMQVKIVFCSVENSKAFCGYFSQNTSLCQIVRSIGYEMEFIEMQNSKIIFPQKSVQKNYRYSDLQSIAIKEIPETLVMAFNLDVKNKQQKDNSFSFGANSNEAVAGDMNVSLHNSIENLRNDGTVSTGAETLSLALSHQINRQFRVQPLFEEKKPQEIIHLKRLAQTNSEGHLIKVKNLSKEEIESNMEEIIAEIMNSGSSLMKKKESDNK